MLNHSTLENTQPLLLSMPSLQFHWFSLHYCKSPVSQIFIFPYSFPPWSSLIFFLLLQIVHIKCSSLCFSYSASLRHCWTSSHMCICLAWNWCCSHSKAREGQWYSCLEPWGKTDRNWAEHELLGKTSLSRNQKRRVSSVFFCPKQGQRTHFWLTKSEWQRADNVRFIFHVKYFSCRYWGEMENTQLMNNELWNSFSEFFFWQISL